MMDGKKILWLRTNAERCRRLADGASDEEVARVLKETAAEIEAAIPILEEHTRRGVNAND